MGRRGGTLTVRCRAEGCRETGFYTYDSQRERAEIEIRYGRDWACGRHAQPDKVLSLENPAVQKVLVCTQKTFGLTWIEEGAESGNGFSFSAAHKAWADDFPPGTRLIVTAYIETPEQAQVARKVDTDGATS